MTEELYLNCKNSIASEQHGFYKGRSTATNLLIYEHFLSQALEAGHQVDCIYTDIAKAFDSVHHGILRAKLETMGVRGNYLQWIVSYLSQRRQCVKIGDCLSNPIFVHSGVPQGSHIGPVLFLLFFNDVTKCFNYSNCLLYADDLKFFTTVSSDSDTNALQADFDKLNAWCHRNALRLNVSKCRVLRVTRSTRSVFYNYHLDGTTVDSVNQFNDLGVIFDANLTFIPHIDEVVLRSFRMLGFVRRSTQHIQDCKAILALYFSFIRSILEYNSTIWSPFYQCHIQKLERVQNKFVKFYLFKYRFPYQEISYSDRLKLVGIPSLQTRRDNAAMFFLHKIINGYINCHEIISFFNLRVPTIRTRQFDLFYIPFHRTNYGMNCCVSKMASLYNESYKDYDIFAMSFSKFKDCISAEIR